MSSFVINPFFYAQAGGAPPVLTGTTWNPADKGSNIALSGGDLVATQVSPSAQWCAVRGVNSASSGIKYFEVTFAGDNGSQGYFMVGVGNSSAALDNAWVGRNVNSWGWQPGQALRWHNNASAAYGPAIPISTSAVIGVLLDFTAGTLVFTYNGASQGTAYISMTGTLFPMCAVVSNVQTGIVTARFGSGSWSTTPAGATEW